MQKMMEQMQKMCKNMNKTNIPQSKKDMKMPNNDMMEQMSIMKKMDCGSYNSCKEFMTKFMKK